MRFLHVIPSVNPISGGPVEALRQRVLVLRALGQTVQVVSLDKTNTPYVNEFPCKVHALGPATLNYAYCPRLVPWLNENGHHFDSIIAHGIWQYTSFGVWRALRRTNIPYFVFPHGMLDPWFKYRYPAKHLKKLLYWPWAEYRVLRDARAVLFTSEDEMILARQSFSPYRCREVVVSYGTASASGDELVQRSAFLNRFPHLENKRLILFLGRVHPKKGCDLLIRAFAKMLPKHSNIHLLICGPDQIGWTDSLKSIISHLNITGHVTWTGMLTGDLKAGALRSSEVLALPSHQENFGVAVAEALAHSVPVLISNKVNIWREIEADRAGFVDQDTIDGTIGLFDKWLSLSLHERLEFKANSLKCFENRFEIHKAVDSYLRFMTNECFQGTVPANVYSLKENSTNLIK